MKKQCSLCFATESGGNYLYDSETGAVIPTNNIISKALELYTKCSIEDTRAKLLNEYSEDMVNGTLDFIERWESIYGGFYRTDEFIKQHRQNMESFTEEDIKEYIESGNLYQLVINLTEDCNLRCKYCYLTEVYEYTRNRTYNKMSYEVGIRSLDNFFKLLEPIARKIPAKHAGITFYGGETLLEFSLLRKLVQYAKTNSPLPLVFNMTTNGYLLNDEIMDFIVSNDINVAVSLDGTKENHDRNRVLPNGKGTFDIVFNNIKRFKERYPSYLKLTIITVFDYKTDLEANVKFFEENDLPRIVFLNGVADVNTNYYDRFTKEDVEKFFLQKGILEKKYHELKKQGKTVSEYLRAFMETPFTTILIREMHDDTRSSMVPYTSTCVPGIKISVRVEGSFDMCERVNQTIPIGNIDTGIDYAAIKSIIESYNKTVCHSCADCSLSKMCSLCFAQCNGDCEFYYPDNWCNNSRRGVAYNFSQVFSILEDNKNAFKHFESRVTADRLYNL